MSPAEYFNRTQGGTITPHGRVVPGSVQDVPGGRVRYAAEGGGLFEVAPVPNRQGGYRYANARRVDPATPP